MPVKYFSTAGGLEFISEAFQLCTPLKTTADVSSFQAFLADTYVNFAMVDYPYPANFLADLPAWPITVKTMFFFFSKNCRYNL